MWNSDLFDFMRIDFVHSFSHNLLPISFSNIWIRKDTLQTFPRVWNDLDEPDIKDT